MNTSCRAGGNLITEVTVSRQTPGVLPFTVVLILQRLLIGINTRNFLRGFRKMPLWTHFHKRNDASSGYPDHINSFWYKIRLPD